MCYIKKKDAISAMHKAINDRTWSMSDRDVMEQMEEYVEALPTADVVEVVRCEDCKHQEQCCEFIMISGKDKTLDFCSYGEKKN